MIVQVFLDSVIDISNSDVQGPAQLESPGLGLGWAGSGLARLSLGLGQGLKRECKKCVMDMIEMYWKVSCMTSYLQFKF